jgi:hypothetical protein
MSEKNPDDSKHCPECKSSRLELVNTREGRAPGSGLDGPVLAKALHIRCRRCSASWEIVRRVTN